jgi:hypothetical protein
MSPRLAALFVGAVAALVTVVMLMVLVVAINKPLDDTELVAIAAVAVAAGLVAARTSARRHR